MSNKDECTICFENINEKYAIVPCGHTGTCGTCLEKINKCPLCNTDIGTRLKLY